MLSCDWEEAVGVSDGLEDIRTVYFLQGSGPGLAEAALLSDVPICPSLQSASKWPPYK